MNPLKDDVAGEEAGGVQPDRRIIGHAYALWISWLAGRFSGMPAAHIIEGIRG